MVSSGWANVTLLRAAGRPGVGRRSADVLTKAEVGGVAAGRPLRGGTATATSGGDRQGLRQSVETTSVLVPTCSLNVMRKRSRTR